MLDIALDIANDHAALFAGASICYFDGVRGRMIDGDIEKDGEVGLVLQAAETAGIELHDIGLMIIITTKIVDYLENMTDVIVLAIRI